MGSDVAGPGVLMGLSFHRHTVRAEEVESVHYAGGDLDHRGDRQPRFVQIRLKSGRYINLFNMESEKEMVRVYDEVCADWAKALQEEEEEE